MRRKRDKDMRKRYLSIAALLVLLVLLAVAGPEEKEEEAAFEECIECEEDNVYDEKTDAEKEEAALFEESYRILNRRIFDDSVRAWYGDETKQEIEEYAESVKGDLVQVWEEDSIFPRGLVMKMEEVIYQSLDSNMNRINWEEIEQSIYYQTMRELGKEKWHPDFLAEQLSTENI